MNILVIKDDKPGHYNQTEGLLLSLKEIYPEVNVEYIDVEIQSKISRKILRVLLNSIESFFGKRDNAKYIKYFYSVYTLPTFAPDLIISTGGNTANLNVWFSKMYQSKNILNGKLRGLKEELFNYVTTVIDLGYKNQILIDVAPNTIRQEILKESSLTFMQKNSLYETYYTLLIGGDGAGYYYDDIFYENLIQAVINISKRDKIKWLITTSRRTPQQIEYKLKRELEGYYGYFVAYNEKPEKVLFPFFGLSKAIFVTEESSSMISEGISARKPLYTITPYEAKPDKNYREIIEKFLEKGLIKSIPISQLEKYEIKNHDFKILEDDAYIVIAERLKPYLLERV